MSDVVVSGMRATGPLHLGNYWGALNTWLDLQEDHECYFFVADWHALTTGYDDTGSIQEYTRRIVIDWLSTGLDPDQCTIFRQSDVPEHAELHLLFEMITPVSWLERNPTYKDAVQELGEKRTRHTGFLAYPVLQTADVLAYRGTKVPVGEDQKPHLEIGRRIARRFNDLYDADLPEMDPLIKDTPKLLGLDGRKMSKSYDNCIYLSDSPDERKDKIMSAKTDTGPDEPGQSIPEEGPIANLFRMLELFGGDEEAEQYRDEYREADIQYGYMKQDLAEVMNDYFEEMDERRRSLEENPGKVDSVLEQGREEARSVAGETLHEVKSAMNLAN